MERTLTSRMAGRASARPISLTEEKLTEDRSFEAADTADAELTRVKPRRWNVLLGVFASVAALGLAVPVYDGAQSAASQSSEPRFVIVSTGDIEVLVSATGTIQPFAQVEVGAQVSGQLEALHAQIGDLMTSGELLARIDASVQKQRVAASRATLAAETALLEGRTAEVKQAQADVERYRELVATRSSSQFELDAAIRQLAQAKSSLAALNAQISGRSAMLASDEAQLTYSDILAPMSGTVVSIAATPGQTLNANQHVPTILTIADLSTMRIRADVSEADIGKIEIGAEAYFTTLGGEDRRWTGSVRQILPMPAVRNNVVFFPVLFDVPNPDGALLPQMTAQAFFVIDKVENVVTLPASALKTSATDEDSAVVQVVNAAGEVEERAVKIGITDRVRTEIREGLLSGDKVVSG